MALENFHAHHFSVVLLLLLPSWVVQQAGIMYHLILHLFDQLCQALYSVLSTEMRINFTMLSHL